MSSRLGELRERRLAIVAACEEDRGELSTAFARVQRELHVADRVVAGAQRVARHKAVLGVIVAGLLLAPAMTRKWIRRASWWLPIAIQGYRIIQSSRRRRDESSTAE